MTFPTLPWTAAEGFTAFRWLVDVLSAISTIAVAAWGYGTWKLYRIEARRAVSTPGWVAGRLAYLERHCDALHASFAAAQNRDPGGTGIVRGSLLVIRDNLAMTEHELSPILDESRSVPMTVMAQLDVAKSLLMTGRILVETTLERTIGTPQFRQGADRVREHLAELRGAFDRAYNAIPQKDRKWGDANREYKELLDDAFEPLQSFQARL